MTKIIETKKLDCGCDTYIEEVPTLFHEGWDIKDEQGNVIQYWPDDFYIGALYEAYFTNTGENKISISDNVYEDTETTPNVMEEVNNKVVTDSI